MKGQAQSHFDRTAGLFVLSLLVLGCLLVLRPFFSAILWAVVLSCSTWPAYHWFLRKLGGRRTLAAAIMMLLLISTFVVPLIVVSASLAEQTRILNETLKSMIEQGLPSLPSWIESIPLAGQELNLLWEDHVRARRNLSEFIKPYIGTLAEIIKTSGAVIAYAVFQLFLSNLICFFFYRDGTALGNKFSSIVERIAGDRGERLLKVATHTIKGVVYGILGTAVAQAILAAIGFWIVGVPAAMLLGFLTFFLSMVPIGPPLVWLPVALWLILSGKAGWGIFMLIWGTFVVSGVDNFLKPYLISRSGHLPFIMIFLGVLGGVIAFGFIGVFLGPTLLGLGYSLIAEWTSDKGQGSENT